jgi:hypothetical protein
LHWRCKPGAEARRLRRSVPLEFASPCQEAACCRRRLLAVSGDRQGAALPTFNLISD